MSDLSDRLRASLSPGERETEEQARRLKEQGDLRGKQIEKACEFAAELRREIFMPNMETLRKFLVSQEVLHKDAHAIQDGDGPRVLRCRCEARGTGGRKMGFGKLVFDLVFELTVRDDASIRLTLHCRSTNIQDHSTAGRLGVVFFQAEPLPEQSVDSFSMEAARKWCEDSLENCVNAVQERNREN
jgi:hypothetical protein